MDGLRQVHSEERMIPNCFTFLESKIQELWSATGLLLLLTTILTVQAEVKSEGPTREKVCQILIEARNACLEAKGVDGRTKRKTEQ